MGIKKFINEEEKADKTIGELYEAMTGAEIGRQLGITRQEVSNTLKRAMKKMFDGMKKEDPAQSDFEIAVALQVGLGIGDHDAKAFFKLFPPAIRKKIEASAKELMPKK